MIHLHQIITKIICVGFRQNYSVPTGSKNIINNCRKSFNVEYFVLALMYFWPQAKWSDSVVVYKRLQKITSLLVQFQSKLEIWMLYITVLLTAYIFSLPHHYLERERDEYKLGFCYAVNSYPLTLCCAQLLIILR